MPDQHPAGPATAALARGGAGACYVPRVISANGYKHLTRPFHPSPDQGPVRTARSLMHRLIVEHVRRIFGTIILLGRSSPWVSAAAADPRPIAWLMVAGTGNGVFVAHDQTMLYLVPLGP